MNTKSLSDLRDEFNTALSFDSESEQIEHDAKMLMFSFLSEVQKFQEAENINRRSLANKIKTSSSYLTQLFRGNKPLNFVTIAKFQKSLDIKFDIKAYPKDAIIKDRIIYKTVINVNLSDDPVDTYDFNDSAYVTLSQINTASTINNIAAYIYNC